MVAVISYITVNVYNSLEWVMGGELLKQAIYREGGEQEKDDVHHFRPT